MSGYGIDRDGGGGGGGGGGTTVTQVTISASDFSANDYTNATIGSALFFEVFSNDGSGTLLLINDGYTVVGNVITMTPGNYKIIFFS